MPPDLNDMTLNGVTMAATTTDAIGSVSGDTLMVFEQSDGVISARYRGGAIVDGYLLGTIAGASLHFRYVQLGTDGRLDAGMSTGTLERLADGRLRLTEYFEWQSRPGRGTNIFDEIEPA